MGKKISDWIHSESKEGKKPEKKITLDDVEPMHPEDYPAKHLKERLDAHRDRLEEIETRSHPSGLPNGEGALQ